MDSWNRWGSTSLGRSPTLSGSGSVLKSESDQVARNREQKPMTRRRWPFHLAARSVALDSVEAERIFLTCANRDRYSGLRSIRRTELNRPIATKREVRLIMSRSNRRFSGLRRNSSRQLLHALPLVLSACGVQSDQPFAELTVTAQRQNLFLVPEVYRVTPPVVPTSGGTIVTVEGKNFLRDINVTIDGRAATVVSLDDTEHVRVRVPVGTKGTSIVEASNLGTAIGTVKAKISYFEDTLDFRHPQSLSTASSPVDAALADMNADGRTDVVILAQNEIRVFLQDATDAKKFSALPPVSLPSRGGQLAIADLDGDGFRDVVVTHTTTNYLSTWRNDRRGGLSSAGIFSISASSQPTPSAIILADLNGDSKPDAVVTNSYSPEIGILFGTGGMGFAPVKNTALTRSAMSLSVADVNGDRYPDLIVGSAYPAVSIFLNDTKGAIPAAPSRSNLSTGGYATGLGVADLTGDGFVDIAVLDSYYSKVRLLIGQANGVFAESSMTVPTTLDIVSSSTNAIYLDDYDGDGQNDIVLSSSSPSVFRGLGAGRFGVNTLIPISSGYGTAIRVGDLNRDGRVDALLLGFRSNVFTAKIPQTLMLFNQGGSWQDVMTPVGGYPGNLLVENFDRTDGTTCADVAPVDVMTARYAVNGGNCSGIFNPIGTGSGTLLALPNSCVSADVNLDGSVDLLCSSNASGSDKLSMRLGNGDGTFRSVAPISTRLNPSAMVPAFIYDTSWPDFVVVHPEKNTLSVLKNKQIDPPAFALTAYDLGMGIAPTAVAVADFNKDGLTDLVATSFSTNKAYFIPNKMGVFDTAMMVGFPTGKNPSAIVSGDFNNDGNPDVAIAHYGDDSVIVYLGDGMGSFPYTRTVKAMTGCQPSALSVADWNGDNAVDLMVTCDLTIRYPDPAVQFLIGVGDGNFGISSAVVYLPFQGAAVAKDVTGDGLTDVVAAYGGSRGAGTGQMFSLIHQ